MSKEQILRLFEDTSEDLFEDTSDPGPGNPEISPLPVCNKCGSTKCGKWDEDATSEWLALNGEISLTQLTVCQRERVEKIKAMSSGWESSGSDGSESDGEYACLTRIESVDASPELIQFLKSETGKY